MKNNKTYRVLAIDDNPDALFVLEQTLLQANYEVLTLSSGLDALKQARLYDPDLVLVDMMMPHRDGHQVVRDFKLDPTLRYVPIFFVTANDSLKDVVKGLSSGADGYITKPFKPEELIARVAAALRMRALYLELASKDAENKQLRQELEGDSLFVGQSSSIDEVKNLVKKVSKSDIPVLILGSSGTGKELVARAIHYLSDRRNGKLIAKNCAAFSAQLIESELFGHKKGAFTGAVSDKIGLIEAASEGTLFLDEIGEMPIDLQAKLLRVLEEGSVMAVGDNTERAVNTRIIAATNRDLKEMVEKGLFREDLYYRLNVVTIKLPDLRDRRGDISILANHFAKTFAEKYGHSVSSLSKEILDKLENYEWPGNIRELRNEVERLYLFAEPGEELTTDLLSEHVAVNASPTQNSQAGTLQGAIEEIEIKFISEALAKFNGNKSHVAKELGISRSNLLAKIKAFGL